MLTYGRIENITVFSKLAADLRAIKTSDPYLIIIAGIVFVVFKFPMLLSVVLQVAGLWFLLVLLRSPAC
jgi:hypothetical protein